MLNMDPIFLDKCTIHLSSKKLLFAEHGSYCIVSQLFRHREYTSERCSVPGDISTVESTYLRLMEQSRMRDRQKSSASLNFHH